MHTYGNHRSSAFPLSRYGRNTSCESHIIDAIAPHSRKSLEVSQIRRNSRAPWNRLALLGSEAEHALYEAHLINNVGLRQPANLAPANGVHSLISRDRVQGSVD